MSSLHHWLVALARGLKRDKHKRRIEEPRRDRLKLEAYREQMKAEALVEVERLGMMGGRPHEMRLGTYRRPERPKRWRLPTKVTTTRFQTSRSIPAAAPRAAAGRMEAGDGHARRQARRPWSTSDNLKPS